MNSTIETALRIASSFVTDGTPCTAEECCTGHINQTFFVTCAGGVRSPHRYVLQEINTSVFRNPDGVMENVARVTAHIRQKLIESGGDSERGTLIIVPTTSGDLLLHTEADEVWRMYEFTEGTVCLQTVESPEMFAKVGYAFGHFQRQLADFDATLLHESIPHFHDTVSRYHDFMTAVERDLAGRAGQVSEEIQFVTEREQTCSYIMERIADGRLPLRVTHNDTKLNNILLDRGSMEGLCVIDLDTVMPGSVLCDFGDSIRFGASSASEDETDLNAVYMRLEMFDAFASGFISGLDHSLTEEEIRDMPMGALILTLETGIRFLTDYLNGDTYFRISYPQHNLDRARNQFKLVRDMEVKLPLMDAIIKKYI